MGSLRKRSVQLSGHATSIALEPEFWAVLEVMAEAQGLSLAASAWWVSRSKRAGSAVPRPCAV